MKTALTTPDGRFDYDGLIALDAEAFERYEARETGTPFSLHQVYRRVKELTVTGYYTSEVGGTEELTPIPMGDFRDVPFDDIGRAYS